MPADACHVSGEDVMFMRWKRMVFVSAAVAGLAGCGRSPTAPEAPASTVVLTQGESATIPGTDLRVTVLGLATVASIECQANVPCNLTPVAFLEVKVPSAGAEFRNVRLPNDGGGDRASYGGYLIRVPSLQQAMGPTPFKLVIEASRE
jgi:hypothetical protein